MEISQGSIEEALELQNKIPEFTHAYSIEEYQKRLKANHLTLIAKVHDEPVGFKVGYALSKSTLYSWMGAVIPAKRGLGVAKRLADYQEKWAKEQGYQTIRFKTRNYLKPMLMFALKRGFHIVEIEKKDYSPSDYRIILEKNI